MQKSAKENLMWITRRNGEETVQDTCLKGEEASWCSDDFHEFCVKRSLDNKQKEEEGWAELFPSLWLTRPLLNSLCLEAQLQQLQSTVTHMLDYHL